MEKSNSLAILILAAGSSSRLGEPKQLVEYKGETLLEIVLKKALKVSQDVFIVLGDEKQECEKIVSSFKVKTLFNPNYKDGMGSSISFGINHTKGFENTMILLVDQPFIPFAHLQTLKDKINKEFIVASNYTNTPSVPAVFCKKYYKELLGLHGDKGAKSILQKESIVTIKLKKEQGVDIDTLEDIEKYLR